MELRLYWRIVKQRLLWVIALVALVALSYGVWRPSSQTLYTASMRFTVGIKPEAATGEYYRYDRYYTWLTAEYLLDDLAEVVKSRVFAADVSTLSGLAVPAGTIQAATATGKLHRILSVQLTWSQPNELALIANAIVQTLQEHGDKYFAQLSTGDAVVALIDPPQVTPVGPSLRQRLDLPLRLILALIAGIGLAFLLDYLDTSVRHRDDLAELGIPILAEIPTRSRWWQHIWRGRFVP